MELDRRDDPIQRRSTPAGRARVVAGPWLDGSRSSPASVSTLQRRIVAWFVRAFDQPVWVTGEIVDVDLRVTWCRLQLVSPESDRGFVSDPAAEASQVWTFVGTRELWSIAGYLRSRGRGLDDFFRIGNRISLRGTVRYWEQGNRFEVAVDIVDARTGEGWLAGWRRITARRLEREGLFARQRSRCPPPIPTRVAVVSTRFGEARRDVHAVLRRADLDWVADDGSFALSRLEGAGAAEHIAERITAAAASGVDAVVVTRGGGDRLALAVFDAECVVRAIAEAPVPIITGIGHAADLTLADRAAWQHASTPTDAADAVAHAHRAASGEIDRVHGEIDDARRSASLRLATTRRHRIAIAAGTAIAMLTGCLLASEATRSVIPVLAGVPGLTGGLLVWREVVRRASHRRIRAAQARHPAPQWLDFGAAQQRLREAAQEASRAGSVAELTEIVEHGEALERDLRGRLAKGRTRQREDRAGRQPERSGRRHRGA